MIETARQGDTLDAICWRVFGRTAGITEQVLTLNPDAVALGPVLPAGTPVILPDAIDAAPRVLQTINLWD